MHSTTQLVAGHLRCATTAATWSFGRGSLTGEPAAQMIYYNRCYGCKALLVLEKSAIAQSCAEALEKEGKVCASIFFSRPNKRDDPNRVFTSIAYQLATKCTSIADILDSQILNDSTILNAVRPVQFKDLIVKPLRQVTPQSLPFEEWVIILDGLDELDGVNAQAEIIDIVATSIHERTTPFRWFILSRPELHIQRAMNSDDVSSLLYTLYLPLSSPDDHEILIFFQKELEKIRGYYKLPDTWCSEAEVDTIVKLADGM